MLLGCKIPLLISWFHMITINNGLCLHTKASYIPVDIYITEEDAAHVVSLSGSASKVSSLVSGTLTIDTNIYICSGNITEVDHPWLGTSV